MFMKKSVLLFVLGVFALSGSFAKKWTNNVGAGFTVPFSLIGVDESGADDITQFGYGIDGIYVGQMDNGFMTKANYSIGLATSDDVSVQDRNMNLGIFLNFSVGAGYAFIHTQKFTLGLTGMIGFDISAYPHTEEDIVYAGSDDGKADLDTALTMAMFSAGADIYASYKLKEHLGLFANLAVRCLVAGTSELTEIYTYKDGGADCTLAKSREGSDLLGKIRVQPSLGVIWNF